MLAALLIFLGAVLVFISLVVLLVSATDQGLNTESAPVRFANFMMVAGGVIALGGVMVAAWQVI